MAGAGDVGGPPWQAVVDTGSGRTYCYNATTQITQSEVPGDVPAAKNATDLELLATAAAIIESAAC